MRRKSLTGDLRSIEQSRARTRIEAESNFRRDHLADECCFLGNNQLSERELACGSRLRVAVGSRRGVWRIDHVKREFWSAERFSCDMNCLWPDFERAGFHRQDCVIVHHARSDIEIVHLEMLGCAGPIDLQSIDRDLLWHVGIASTGNSDL